MEHKAAKKAKKGILSIVFSRTALIVMLILLQIGALVLMYTILNDYLTYVYWITMAVQVFVIIYITNEQGTPEYSRTWILLILILPVFGCLFYVYVKLEIGTKYVGERLIKTKLDTSPYLMQKAEVVEESPREQTGKCDSGLLYESSTAVSDIQEYKSNILQYRAGKICRDDPPAETCGKIYFSGIFYCIRGIYVGYDPGYPERKGESGSGSPVYVRRHVQYFQSSV